MAHQQREICKVGESPTPGRRSLSPRVKDGTPNAEENSENTVARNDSPSPDITLLPSSPENTRSPSKGERKTGIRLLQGKQESPSKAVGKSPKHANWKTSKFFSRSMASGELLKGLKKLSTSSPVSNTATGSEESTEPEKTGTTDKESDSKSFKSRFSSLRRKSGSDTDTVPKVDSESLKVTNSCCRCFSIYYISIVFLRVCLS